MIGYLARPKWSRLQNTVGFYMSWGIRQENICFWRMALFYGDNIILVWGEKEKMVGKWYKVFFPWGVGESLGSEPLHLIHLHLDRFICSCVLILIYWGMGPVVLSCNTVKSLVISLIISLSLSFGRRILETFSAMHWQMI